MENAPLVISVVSISVAALTLGWTIYRDAIRRPKLRVSIAPKTIVQEGALLDGPHIFVEALNVGPLPNRLGLVFARKAWWQRWTSPDDFNAHIMSDFSNQAATPAGARLEVGDIGIFVFPYIEGCFLKEEFVRIGVADGYGTIHWAPRRQLRTAREKYFERFPGERPLRP